MAAKKGTAKTAETKQVNAKKEQTEPVDINEQIVELEEDIQVAKEPVAPDAEKLKEALDKVDVEIKDDQSVDDAISKIEEAFEPLKEIDEEIKKIDDRNKSLQQEIIEHPENAEAAVKEEIKKAEELKAKIEKTISAKKPRNITSWWNGNGYDF